MEKKKVTKESKDLTEDEFGIFEKNFEKHMTNIAKSFSVIDERFDKIEERLARHDKAFEMILKQMQVYTDEAREHRQMMSSLIHTDVKQERELEDLKIRVERLEMQSK